MVKPPRAPIPLMTRASPSTTVRVLELPPTVYFANRAMEDMRILVALCPEEVGWLGTARRVGRTFYVDEIFLPKQHAGPAHTTITTEGLSQLMDELTRAGRAKLLDRMFFWGHSHANMPADFSGQDDLQMAKLSRHSPWFIRAVLNKYGDMKVDVFMREEGMAYLNVPWVVHAPVPKQRLAFWQERLALQMQSPPRRKHGQKGLPAHMVGRGEAELDSQEVSEGLDPPDEAQWEAALERLGRGEP